MLGSVYVFVLFPHKVPPEPPVLAHARGLLVVTSTTFNLIRLLCSNEIMHEIFPN